MTAMPTVDRRADYVSAVAVELGDLAPDDRAELIEELDDHIAALLEDRPDTDLVAELGTPRAYAAELRTAAGLAGTTTPRPSTSARLRAVVEQLDGALPWVRPVVRFLRPAWWVLRGAAVGAAAARIVGIDYPSGGVWVAMVIGVLASLWVGQQAPVTRRWRIGVAVVDVVVVLVALWVVAVTVANGSSSVYYDTQYVPNCPGELDNLYAYDASGKPLQDVRLYDQYGQAFDISAFGCGNGQFAPGDGPNNAYPWPTYSFNNGVDPTGPPSSLTPLPGATVSSGTPTAPVGSPTPSVSATP